MSTVAEVADRALREYLTPPDDQPAVITLDASVDATETEWSYSASMLAPDELDLLAPGVIVEGHDGEQCLVRDVEDTSISVLRGYNGTVPSAHPVQSAVVISPTFGRRLVLEAVKDEVRDLYPDLYHVSTVSLTSSEGGFIEVPADVVAPLSTVVSTGRGWQPIVADLMANFPPSKTGKAIQLRRGDLWSRALLLTYKGRFLRPDNDADELSEFHVDRSWERILAAGAAAQAVALRDADQLTAEYVTRQLEREALPNDAPRGVRDGLLQLRATWLDQASRALSAQHPVATVHQPLGVVSR